MKSVVSFFGNCRLSLTVNSILSLHDFFSFYTYTDILKLYNIIIIIIIHIKKLVCFLHLDDIKQLIFICVQSLMCEPSVYCLKTHVYIEVNPLVLGWIAKKMKPY